VYKFTFRKNLVGGGSWWSPSIGAVDEEGCAKKASVIFHLKLVVPSGHPSKSSVGMTTYYAGPTSWNVIGRSSLVAGSFRCGQEGKNILPFPLEISSC
jgi:hypothetical protein